MGELQETVQGGDRRASLEAIRDRLATELEVAIGRDVAALSKQLSDTIRELDSLPPAKGVTRVDQLAAARKNRRKAAAGS